MKIVWGLSCALLLFTVPAVVPSGRQARIASSPVDRGCEPTGVVDLVARLASITRHAGRATAMVQLDLESHVPLEDTRLGGRDKTPGAAARGLGIDDQLGAVPARVPRARTYRIDLDEGTTHELYFTLTAESGGAVVRTTARLLLDLDPARQPVRIDDVLQYRARMEEP